MIHRQVYGAVALKKSQQPAHEKPGRRYPFAIRVYADADQRAELERKAKLAGVKSLSTYLLMAGLERPDRVR